MSDDKIERKRNGVLGKLDAMDIRQNRDEALKKKKILKELPFVAVLVICALAFVYCSYYLIDYYVDAKKQEALYGNLSDIVDQNRPSLPQSTVPQPLPDDSTEPSETPGPTEPVILPEYQAIYELNNELVGWISIPGTRIDYPVMQSHEDPNFYLDHDFKKKWNSGGCIYARKQCDVFKPSDNIILYGHHMKNGSMFAGLDKYIKRNFWEKNQFFNFDTLYERHTYQIIAVFKVTATNFDYHLFNDAANKEEFDSFMDRVHELQLYDTGLTAQYGDKLLTLSTCEYTLYDGRLVVLAKRIY